MFRQTWLRYLLWCLSCSLLTGLSLQARSVEAGIYNADSEVIYKEYWIPHSQFTGGCTHPLTNSWYLEPWPGCIKELNFTIPDDFSRALKVELYLDIWRGRRKLPIRYTINNGPVERPPIGEEWSRTPYVVEVPKTQLRQGNNVIAFWDDSGGYHIHDIALRIYHNVANPLVAGAGSDVTPPTGRLTAIVAANGAFDPTQGGTLRVDNNQLTMTADANGAAYVEFHAYYQGYDEDLNGQSRDWHNLNRNNYNPGGVYEKPTGGTINHLGTDTLAPYNIVWNLPTVVNQSNVKFKLRLVDSAGNVREGASSVSAPFILARDYAVETYTIPDFVDSGIYLGGTGPNRVERSITLPNLNNVTAAYMVGAYWGAPYVSLNGNPEFLTFETKEDYWSLSSKAVPVDQLRGGNNLITYIRNIKRTSYGQFVEKPGPMIVLHRNGGGGEPPTSTPTPTNTPVTPPTPTPTNTPISGGRVMAGLQALYLFNEGTGRVVNDSSGVGTALNLTIDNRANTTWISGGGLAINAPVSISSEGPASKIINACKASNELTVEAWVQPANTTQSGPAKIVTLSNAPSERNFSLGQGLWGDRPSDLYNIRLRLAAAANDLTVNSSSGALNTALTHVVYTRKTSGLATLYLNGSYHTSKNKAGLLSNWKADFRLVLANELTGDRPWLGNYFLVAFYCRALSAADVQQNYQVGVNGQFATDAIGVASSDDPMMAPGVYGLVWVDANQNGEYEEDETLVQGAQVTLLDRESKGDYWQETVTTEANGRYEFADLPAGAYILSFVLPEGLLSAQNSLEIHAEASNAELRFIALPVRQTERHLDQHTFLPLVAR
jgi:hypothetical protein